LSPIFQEDLEAQKANLNITCPNTTDQQDTQVDLKALVVPEDQADQEDLEDPEAQVSICC
jgi:hypothetical protein